MNHQRFSSMLVCAGVVVFLSACGPGGGERGGNDTTGTDTATVAATPAVNTVDTTPQDMMTVMHKVADFEKWNAGYDAHDSARLASQVHSYVIGRGVEDSNMVLVAMKVDDRAKAKAFGKDAGLKNVMQKAGVRGTPIFSHVRMTYQDTATIDTDLRVSSTFTVKDWDTWQRAFEEDRQLREDNGLVVRAYGHDVDDNHKVMLVMAVTDTAKANVFWRSDSLKLKRAAAGVVGEPERFVFRVVRRY